MASKSDITAQRMNKTVEQLSGLTRPIFFAGKMLTADDLNQEQSYFRELRWLHNRFLHGWGVVDGLGVSVNGTGTGASVVVEPGHALDPFGKDLIVNVPISLPVCDASSPSYVVLEYFERPTNVVPAPGRGMQASSMAEGVAASLCAKSSDGLALGRLLRKGKGWKIDSTFKPRRIKCK
jgi:hypothetical protein